jgi:hypothetical protein
MVRGNKRGEEKRREEKEKRREEREKCNKRDRREIV